MRSRQRFIPALIAAVAIVVFSVLSSVAASLAWDELEAYIRGNLLLFGIGFAVVAVVATAFALDWVPFRGRPPELARDNDDVPLAAERTNRRRLLRSVRAIWIEGVLNRSLQHMARMQLEINVDVDAVEFPWEGLLHPSQASARSVPQDSNVQSAFEELNESLLIVGAPGSGKTTMLLELADMLLTRAESDEAALIPVVLNLSSWTKGRGSISDWLVTELQRRYRVPRRQGKQWVAQGRLLPLLDGLDEVVAERRNDCIGAINSFIIHEHPHGSIVICSRSEDYSALQSQLKLGGAIAIQPLTPQKIDKYLDDAGRRFAGVRATLSTDAELAELLKTPLVLNIMVLTYQHRDVDEFLAAGNVADRRRRLFQCYIAEMLRRRGEGDAMYSSECVQKRLAWLARNLAREGEAIFYLEHVKPDWVVRPWRARVFIELFTGLFAGALVGLSGGLSLGLAPGLLIWLGAWFMALQFNKGRGRQEPGFPLAPTVGFEYSFSLRGPLDWLRRWLVGWLKFWTCIGALIIGIPVVIIGLVDGLGSYHFKAGLLAMPVWLAFGAFIGLFLGLAAAPIAGGFLKGVPSRPQENSRPNEGVLGEVIGVTGTIALGMPLLARGIFWASEGGFELAAAIALATAGGLTLWLHYGQFSVRHYATRLCMARDSVAPLRYARFLDYAAERLLLRKIGGGYTFVHRLLLEHFASLPEPALSRDRGEPKKGASRSP